MNTGSRRIGMLGGTFNPVHLGHIGLAEAFIGRLKLDRVMLMPAFIPPHKECPQLVSAQHRYNMCQIAADGHDKIEVSKLEIERGGQSFTSDTLRELKKITDGAELYLITGADMFLTLQDWRRPEEIFSLATICTAPRDEVDKPALLQHASFLAARGARCEVLERPIMQISSTFIRNAVKSGANISSMTGTGVAEYIRANSLYKE